MKKYTSHDMREAASALSSSGVNLKFDKRDISDMLRQAADMMDRAENAIAANGYAFQHREITLHWPAKVFKELMFKAGCLTLNGN